MAATPSTAEDSEAGTAQTADPEAGSAQTAEDS